jgi:hypothetical protein
MLKESWMMPHLEIASLLKEGSNFRDGFSPSGCPIPISEYQARLSLNQSKEQVRQI